MVFFSSWSAHFNDKDRNDVWLLQEDIVEDYAACVNVRTHSVKIHAADVQ